MFLWLEFYKAPSRVCHSHSEWQGKIWPTAKEAGLRHRSKREKEKGIGGQYFSHLTLLRINPSVDWLLGKGEWSYVVPHQGHSWGSHASSQWEHSRDQSGGSLANTWVIAREEGCILMSGIDFCNFLFTVFPISNLSLSHLFEMLLFKSSWRLPQPWRARWHGCWAAGWGGALFP